MQPDPRDGRAGRCGREHPVEQLDSTRQPRPAQATAQLLATALAYGQRGLRVLPIRPGDKRPLTEHGLHDATTDAMVITAWWQQSRNANIGIATGAASGIWVLDIDGAEGEESLLTLVASTNASLPATVISCTPRGGRHIWFTWPSAGPEIRNSAGKLGTGIDVRGEGGYVLAPPSIGANDIGYTWSANCARSIAPAPDWLLRLVAPPPAPPRAITPPPPCRNLDAYVTRAVNGELGRLDTAGIGQRNHTLNRSAFALAQLVKAGALPEPWYRATLESKALAIGLGLVETRKTIDSAFAAAQPRALPEVRS